MKYKILIFISITLLLLTACSINNTVEFPDKVLEEAIRITLDKPTGLITKDDLLRIEFLYLGDPLPISVLEMNLEPTDREELSGDIKNLEGIQYCTNTKLLSIPYDTIDNIQLIENLTNLENLSIFSNFYMLN